jgi:hypothetical protein
MIANTDFFTNGMFLNPGKDQKGTKNEMRDRLFDITTMLNPQALLLRKGNGHFNTMRGQQ